MFEERYAAGREASAEDTVKAAWEPEQQSAGSDPRAPETDGFSTGTKHHSTNSKCQAAGNIYLVRFQK